MKSWTALAPDIIHAYWLKKLTVPANWLTQDKIILIIRDLHKVMASSYYWPIIFLSEIQKLVLANIITYQPA